MMVGGRRLLNNIYLIGFMGAGKSTVGRLISKKLKISFFDTDTLIEKKTGQTIPEIFQNRGEAGFREIESDVVAEVTKQNQIVVALGGGAVMNENSWKAMENTGTIFYIKWPDEVIIERILHSEHRPLVTATDLTERRAALQSKLDSRQAHYHQAQHIINCYEGMSPKETAKQIIQLLENK